MARDLKQLQDDRAKRKDDLAKQELAQRLIDLEAVDALEIELGDSNVAVIDVPYTPGLPTCFAVRVPTDAEAKRYKSRIKGAANNKEIDAVAAAEEIGESCFVYPDEVTRGQMKAARPNALATAGTEALKLSQGKAASEGKG